MPNVTIRPATTGDVPQVRALEERWAGEEISIGFQAADEALLAGFVGGCFFVAEEDGAIVGFVLALAKDDDRSAAVVPAGARYLEIEDLYVAPGHRSGGVGARLVDAAEAWARSSGIRHLVAYSSTRDVDRVLRFYRSRGFHSWSVQVHRELDGE
jgi:GNAT superfamily N-acetyltransferase